MQGLGRPRVPFKALNRPLTRPIFTDFYRFVGLSWETSPQTDSTPEASKRSGSGRIEFSSKPYPTRSYPVHWRARRLHRVHSWQAHAGCTWRARQLSPGVHASCHLACTPGAATAAACKLPWPRPEPRTSIFMGLDCKNERSNGLDLEKNVLLIDEIPKEISTCCSKVVKLFRKYWWCPTIILTWELLGITMELLGMLGIGGTRWGHVWDTFGTRLGCLMLRVVGRMLRVQGLVSRWKYKFKS
jgi:hypothetical protein